MSMDQKVEAVQLNIAIIPEQRIQQEAIKLSETLSKSFDTHFILNTENLFPHVTISQARYPKKNLDKVIDMVKNTVKNITQCNVSLSQFDLVFGEFVFWNAFRSPELVGFHQQIVDSTNSLREGLVIEHVAAMTNLPPEDAGDREKYGALLIGPRYRPHITLTRLRESGQIEKVAKVVGKGKEDHFTMTKIIIGYLGNHGTVNGVIEEIPLG